MSCVYHDRSKGEGCGKVKSIYVPNIFLLLSVPRQCFCCGLLFLLLYVLCAQVEALFCSNLASFCERKCSFGFLLVEF